MAHTTSPQTHAAHPLARAAGLDLGIVAFTIGAVLVSFGTGQGADRWQNIALPPIVMVLAAVALWFAFLEIRFFWRTASETTHQRSALVEVVIALIAMVVAGPMLLLMPFIFLGALA